jgi:hypothetical protein
MDSGDPNIIDKVFSELLKKEREQELSHRLSQDAGTRLSVFDIVSKIDDCIRHLRNYAKKRKDYVLL